MLYVIFGMHVSRDPILKQTSFDFALQIIKLLHPLILLRPSNVLYSQGDLRIIVLVEKIYAFSIGSFRALAANMDKQLSVAIIKSEHVYGSTE